MTLTDKFKSTFDKDLVNYCTIRPNGLFDVLAFNPDLVRVPSASDQLPDVLNECYADHEVNLLIRLIHANDPAEYVATLDELLVAAVSSNTNSFGLRGHVLVNRAGQVWESAINHLNSRPVHTVIQVPFGAHRELYDFAALGFEIPFQRPDMPAELLRNLWAKSKPSDS